jgi:hypothetical protein
MAARIFMLAMLLVACGRPNKEPRGAAPPCIYPEQVHFLCDAGELELISLEPHGAGDARERLHGWRVLGHTMVRGDEVRELAVMIAANVALANSTANCFEPRHAVRLYAGGHTYELVICFACDGVQTFVDGTEGELLPYAGAGQLQFDRVLAQAGVPLAKPAHAHADFQ